MYEHLAVEADTEDRTMSITKRTVSVGNHVYATHNICHFGPGQVPVFIIPTGVVYTLFLLAFMFQIVGGLGSSDARAFATLMTLAAVAAAAWNAFCPKRYGLLMSLNSGEKRFFATNDERGLAVAVDQVQQIMETVEHGSAEITVNETTVTVSHSTVGVVSTGPAGTISAKASGS